MKSLLLLTTTALQLCAVVAPSLANAALPAPSPQQQQAAAVKAQTAAAEVEKAKAELSASMDQIATRWRTSAAHNGWRTYPATATQAPAALQNAAPTSPPPARSEKQGTASPSADVKDPAKKGL